MTVAAPDLQLGSEEVSIRLAFGGIPSNFTIPVTDADEEVSAAAASVSQRPQVRVTNTATTASQTHRVFISLILISFCPVLDCESTGPLSSLILYFAAARRVAT